MGLETEHQIKTSLRKKAVNVQKCIHIFSASLSIFDTQILFKYPRPLYDKITFQ